MQNRIERFASRPFRNRTIFLKTLFKNWSLIFIKLSARKIEKDGDADRKLRLDERCGRQSTEGFARYFLPCCSLPSLVLSPAVGTRTFVILIISLVEILQIYKGDTEQKVNCCCSSSSREFVDVVAIVNRLYFSYRDRSPSFIADFLPTSSFIFADLSASGQLYFSNS